MEVCRNFLYTSHTCDAINFLSVERRIGAAVGRLRRVLRKRSWSGALTRVRMRPLSKTCVRVSGLRQNRWARTSSSHADGAARGQRAAGKISRFKARSGRQRHIEKHTTAGALTRLTLMQNVSRSIPSALVQVRSRRSTLSRAR